MSRHARAAVPPGRPPRSWAPAAVVALLVALQWLTLPRSEPFFNNDETRHVMTGVFFRDFLHDLPLSHARAWAEQYYARYPALGLLIWPPLFYVLEGILMTVLGTGVEVGRLLVAAFAALAAGCTYAMVSRTHGPGRAAFCALLFGLFPVVFTLSGFVMLEVPALALGLFGTLHFQRHLHGDRARNLWLAAGGATAAALVRYDALVFPLAWVVWALAARRARLFTRPRVVAAALVSAAVLLPWYWVAARGVGWLHAGTIAHPDQAGAAAEGAARLLFYFRHLPRALGWAALVPAVAGLVACLAPGRRSRCAPYLALLATTWVVFAPLGELEPRHVFYWTPAWAVLAIEGVGLLPGRASKVLAAAVLAGTAWLALAPPRPHVRGYEEAARFVTRGTAGTRVCLFDGKLEGNFIYQVRRQDPDRRARVARGDRLLYATVRSPALEYREYAHSDSQVVALLAASRAEWIVVETGWPEEPPPAAERLRRVLRSRPDLFPPAAAVRVVSSRADMAGIRLLIYGNRCPAPAGPVDVAPWVPQLRRTVGGGAP